MSLRELLLLVALAALALASIRYATTTWRTAVYSITMVVFMAGAIVAIIDRGPRQAFAIGMVLTMVIYAVLVRNGVYGERGINRELDADEGRLPTTWVASYFYKPVITHRWFDDRTGIELVNYDPNNPPPGVRFVNRRTNTVPASSLFFQIIHSWWALLLGYVGGHIARLVYVRRANELTSQPTSN
jgi:hypothetical protein